MRLERVDAVYVLTMDDGENRMNQAWLDSMIQALDEVDADSDPTALVTVGEGKFFSNGLDLEWLMGSGVDMPAFVADVERLFARFPDLRLDPDAEPVKLHGFEFRGPKAVPVRATT